MSTVTGPADANTNHTEPGRGIPQVGRAGGKPNPLLIVGILVAVLGVMALGAFVVYKKLGPKDAQAQQKNASNNAPTLNSSAFDTETPPPPPPTAPAQPGGTAGPPGETPEQKAARDREERRKRAPLLAFSEAAAGMGNARLGDASSREGGGSLGDAMKATQTTAVSARTLADPSMTITLGTIGDCVLQTAIDSTQPGMTSCVLMRDIYSTDGRVLLLERGSKVVGQYQSGQLRQGMRRIFMLWSRIETPKGVIVNIDSPASDSLGRAGLDGNVNNHFWLRFGSAMLVSVVDDVVKGVFDSRSSSSGNSFEFNSSGDAMSRAADIIVQNTVNIPPTMRKNQGAHVANFFARDLYFGNVYDLARRPGY